VDKEGLGVEEVVMLLVEFGKMLLECEGGGDTPTTGSNGGGNVSVGVLSRRFDTTSCSSPTRVSGVLVDSDWGSKGGGSKLSSV